MIVVHMGEDKPTKGKGMSTSTICNTKSQWWVWVSHDSM